MSVKYRVAIRDALGEAMREDQSVLILGQDVGVSDGLFRLTEGLYQEFGGDRVIDTPISEAATLGMAIGLAIRGHRPVVEVAFSDHLAMGFDAIVNQMAKLRQLWTSQLPDLPIVIRTLTGAGMGGGPQHSQSLEALFAHIPGLIVVAPATSSDAKHLLKASIASPHPVLFLEHKALLRRRGDIQPDAPPIGHASVTRSGSDVTVVSYSAALDSVYAAAESAAAAGIEAEVIDLRTVVPLDIGAILKSVEKTGRLLVVHEAHAFLGLGAEICAQVGERLWDRAVPMRRLTPPRVPVPVDKGLEEAYLVSPDAIVKAIVDLAESGAEQPLGQGMVG